MNKSNTQQLIRDFPHLYRNAREGAQSSMQYGFACGDGWFRLLYELSAQIDERAHAHRIEPTSDRYPVVEHVKEKLGLLRFYCSNFADYNDLIHQTITKSQRTCECCGQPGAFRSYNWIKVACDRCDSRANEIHREQSALWDARSVINEAFAQADAKNIFVGAVVTNWHDEEQ